MRYIVRSFAVALISIIPLAPAMVFGQDAPYVDSKITKDRFNEVTAEDMEMLRSKKILFASRSFGLNIWGGLKALAIKDRKYEFLSSYERFDLFRAGGDVSIIPADEFKKINFIHVLATYWPHTKRMEEIDELMRKEPHNFGKQVDVVIVEFHTALPQNFEQYSEKMDAMRRDFPNVRFIYMTSGFMGPERAKDNENAHAWSEKVRERYQGKQPLYDMGKLLSDDFRGGHAFVPEYSKDPAGVHPNTPEGTTMMAKAFLLILRDTFHWKPAQGEEAPASGATTHPAKEVKVESLPTSHPDYKAVQAILNANGLTKKRVESVTVIENARVVKLYLQEGGIKTLPAEIGMLTELRVLHLYGDRSLKLPLLTQISPAIGKCTKLEELLLNSNDLTTLPSEITALKSLTALSVADNKLKNLPPAVKAWAEKFDAKGLAAQLP